MNPKRRSHSITGLATLIAAALTLVAQNPAGPGDPPRNPLPYLIQNASAPSHVFVRGDREIVTFETEKDWDKLQELVMKTQGTRPGPGLTIRYFKSFMDGSAQPYAVWRPPTLIAGKDYPLVIQLHGTNFNEVLSGNRLTFHGLGVPQWVEEDLPVVYVQCFGRGNTFYRGMGEEDILEAINDVKRALPIDPDRIFIMGHSMGGAGAFTIGLHFPGLFGGIMPLDPAMWEQAARPEPIPDWMKAQVDNVTPSHLYTNARNVDVFFKNAGAGLQRKSTEFSDGIIERGAFSTTESFPRMPHNFGDQYPYANYITALTAHPIRKKPPVVNFETNTLRYNSAYWVTLDRLTRHGEMAKIEATVERAVSAPATGPRFGPGGQGGAPGGGQFRGQGAGQGGAQGAGQGGGQFRGQGNGQGGGQFRPQGAQGAGQQGAAKPALHISTVNLDAFTVRLLDSPLPQGAPITVDGQEIRGPFPDMLHLSRQGGTWHQGEWDGGDIVKRHGLQGPIGDAFNSHFLAVYGEGDRDLAIAELDAIRNPPGPLDNLTDFPLKAAAKVTPDDVASCNLILFGTVESNPVLQRISKLLPAPLLKKGSVFIYPNPESPLHYVVVWTTKVLSGDAQKTIHSGWTMPLNLLPDYVSVENDAIVSAGHFDEQWHLR